MNNKQIIGGVLIVTALFLGYIGYQKSQPTMLENIARGLSAFAPTDKERDQFNLQIDQQFQTHKKGLPFYFFGGVSGICGIALLAIPDKKNN